MKAITRKRKSCCVRRWISSAVCLARRICEPYPQMSSLAWTLERESKLVEVENLRRSALDIERHVLGPENPGILFGLESEAILVGLEGHYSGAEELFRGAIEIASKTNEPSEIATAWSPAEQHSQDTATMLLSIWDTPSITDLQLPDGWIPT